ncbi:MAG TPA: purine-nucleoside phosphorylase [Gemmatimonadaceae bacterium]|nr:purine-nucleoside phosphorylase [Gemmatimonadaceae bacterium]
MNELGAADAARAAAEIHARLQLQAPPVAALILGSGLGAVIERWERRRGLAYDDVPGLGAASIKGHAGRVVAGACSGQAVIAFSGRLHMYEGHSPAAAGFPARIAAALGVRVLLVANAAGGIRESLAPGDLMIIDDHINLSWRNPLVGPVQRGDQHFPDMLGAYDPALRDILDGTAVADRERPIAHGVYASVLGPSYETPAEIRMLATMGADAVGMSTVPEVLIACAAGLRVAGISVITNRAAGSTNARLTHDDVVRVASSAATRLASVVEQFVARL